MSNTSEPLHPVDSPEGGVQANKPGIGSNDTSNDTSNGTIPYTGTTPHTYPDLVSTGDIAKLAGVSIQAVANWKTRYSDTSITNSSNPNDIPMFPRPIVRTGAGPLYSRQHIEAWLKARKQAQQ